MNNFLNTFFSYVFNDCCSCSTKECFISGIDNVSPKFYNKYIYTNTLAVPNTLDRKLSSSTCKINVIKDVNTTFFKNKSFMFIVNYFIEKFTHFNLISKKNNKYFLLGGIKRLSWKNIKNIDIHHVKTYFKNNTDNCIDIYNLFNDINDVNDFNNDDFINLVMYIKYIFWYFRKIIIDSLVSGALQSTDVVSISVGSTKLDSDYDITLYGKYKEILKIINTFNINFEELFFYNSDTIFDTNLYGVSFITSDFTNSEVDDYSCGDSKFSLIEKPNTDYYPITQNIWAFVKTFMKLHKLQNEDENLYSVYKDTLYDSKNQTYIKILKKAEQFVDLFDSNPEIYYKIVKLLELNNNNEHIMNYISYVNYNGNETYLTRGAFLDVVVNTQMCSKDYISLTHSEYFDSFVENITDLMSHYKKDKYTTRVKNTLKKLEIDNVKIYDNLKTIEQIQSKCSKDLIKCTKNLFIYDCLNILKEVSEKYFETVQNDKLLNGILVFNNFIDIISKSTLNFNISTYNLNEK